MGNEKYNTKLFEAIYACYLKLEAYRQLENATEEAKQDAIRLQNDILLALTPTDAEYPGEINTTNFATIKSRFVKRDLSASELEIIASEILNRLERFGATHDPSTVAAAAQFIASTVTGYVPETVSGAAATAANALTSFVSGWTPQVLKSAAATAVGYIPFSTPTATPAALSSGLTAEIDYLKEVQQELIEHMAELDLLEEPEPAEEVVQPFLTNENEDSDASQLVTIVALPHVDESFRLRFASLFEYAICLEQIDSKLSDDLGNPQAREFLEAVLNKILNELGIERDELSAIHNNDEFYKQREQDYVLDRMPVDDCLDLEEYFKSQDQLRKHMEKLFRVLDKSGIKDVALITSFKQCHTACEQNDGVGRVMMRTIRYLRDQAKSVKQDFHHPLLELPGGRTVTLDKLLSRFGIQEFIRSNFKEFSYKEYSDLVRVRTALEGAHELTAHAVTTTPLPAFKFEVVLGERPDFSYGMQTYQQANLEKYAAICAQQMQLAKVLIDNITSQDAKLAGNLTELQEAYQEIIGTTGKEPYRYREIHHRRLHEALNNICTDFYLEAEQLPIQLLVQASNIQKKFDYNIYANDAGNLLITNSGAYSYGQRFQEVPHVPTISSATEFGTNKVTGGIEWSTFNFAANVGRNATELFRGNSKEIPAELAALHHSAKVLKETLGNAKISGPVQKRDQDLFKFCAELKRASFIQRLLKFIINIITVIGVALSTLVPKFIRKAKKSNKGPDRYKINLHKQLMRVQLEQQVEVLFKSLQIANAMQIGNTDQDIHAFCLQRFGVGYNAAGQLELNEEAKAYYKVLAVQEAVKSIADPVIRNSLAVELRIAEVKPDSMDLQERQEYVEDAIKKLAVYGDYLKINAYFKSSKEEFSAKIGSEIDSANLNIHGLAAQDIISGLLSAPSSLEAVKSVFMLSPFINHVLHNLKASFIFSLFVAMHRVQELLHSTSMINEKSKELEVPGSVKKAAEYFVYEVGGLRFDLKCADRMIEILGKNKPTQDTPQQYDSTLVLFAKSLFSKPKPKSNFSTISHAKSNPYKRAKATFIASLQEKTAWQLIELIESTLVFEKKIKNPEKVKDIFDKLRENLAQLKDDEALDNDIVRNRIMLETLPLISKLCDKFELQRDPVTFEFLMLLKSAAGSLSSISGKIIKLQELMSYHGIPDFPETDASRLQAILNKFNLGDIIYQKIAGAVSSGAIDTMNMALAQLPDDVELAIEEPVLPKKKRSWSSH